jgi:2-polyprenyl-3-methyl-5-hydroxy-6-metoxy-1,4-benzoquinol methylase
MEKELRKNIRLSYLGFRKQPMDEYYENVFGIVSRLRIKKILEELKDVEDKFILDVGCEAGWLSLQLVKTGARIIPFDLCKPAIDIFKQKLRNLNLKEKITGPFLATTYDIPIKSSSIDYIVCSEVIQLTPFVNLIMCEFKRILKDGGKLIITFPNEKFKKKLYPFAKIFGIKVDFQSKVTPYHYSLDEIEIIAEKYFKTEKMYQLPSSVFPMTNVIVVRK